MSELSHIYFPDFLWSAGLSSQPHLFVFLPLLSGDILLMMLFSSSGRLQQNVSVRISLHPSDAAWRHQQEMMVNVRFYEFWKVKEGKWGVLRSSCERYRWWPLDGRVQWGGPSASSVSFLFTADPNTNRRFVKNKPWRGLESKVEDVRRLTLCQ